MEGSMNNKPIRTVNTRIMLNKQQCINLIEACLWIPQGVGGGTGNEIYSNNEAVRVTIAAMKKQQVLHILNVCQ
jgi:hypothetical protein